MKLYVLVRKDLTPAQQTVQACHAVAELLGQYIATDDEIKKWFKDHKTIVVLGVKDEEQLAWAYDRLTENGVDGCMFEEPDMEHQPTAFACHPSTDPAELKKLKLL